MIYTLGNRIRIVINLVAGVVPVLGLAILALPAECMGQSLPGPPSLLGWIADLDPGTGNGAGFAAVAVGLDPGDRSVDTVRVSMRLDWGHFGLGEAGALRRRSARLDVHVPVGTSGDVLAFGYGTAEESMHLDDSPAEEYRLRNPGLVYFGLRSRSRAGLDGQWSALGLVSGGDRPGAVLRLDWRRTCLRTYGLGWAGMSTTANLRAPSVAGEGLRRIARTWGAAGGSEVDLSMGTDTRFGLQIHGGYRNSGAASPPGGGHFLSLSAEGDAWEGSLRILAGRPESVSISGLHYRRDSAITGPILKEGQTAGKLFYAESGFRRSIVQLELAGARGHRSVGVGHDRYRLDTSGRLETWAFADLWSQAVVSAFRVRGSIDAAIDWIELRRRPSGPTGWCLAAAVGRFRFRMEEEDWQVGPLGLGRREYQHVVLRTRGAWVVTGEIGREVRLGDQRFGLGLRAALPVAGRIESNREHVTTGSAKRDEEWPGEISGTLSVDW